MRTIEEYKTLTDKTYRWTIGLVILALIIWAFAVYGAIALFGEHDTTANLTEPFSVTMFQQHLKDAGYYRGNVDGKLGPHTQAAWDQWYCDAQAKKDIEGTKKETRGTR